MTNTLEFLTSIACEESKRYAGREYFPIYIGMSEPLHTVKRFAERGGVYDSTVCMETIRKEFAQYPRLIDELLELHQIIESTQQSLVVRLPDNTVYILQYGGFTSDYIEAFDFVTFFDENSGRKKFFSNCDDDILVSVDFCGQIKRKYKK